MKTINYKEMTQEQVDDAAVYLLDLYKTRDSAARQLRATMPLMNMDERDNAFRVIRAIGHFGDPARAKKEDKC